MQRPDCRASLGRQVLRDVAANVTGQEVAEDRQHEQQADHGRDTGRAAAQQRGSVPKPKPSSPTTVRYRAPPMTTRSTPGWLRLVPIPLPCRIAWPRRKAAKHVTRENSRATPANTTALPASMARRCGTAPRVALIVPVEYSAEMTRTPSAPMISCPRNSAFRLKDAG